MFRCPPRISAVAATIAPAWPAAPFAVPGTYVPTASPVGAHWGKRTPWVLTSGAQLRPGAPPALGSEVWARDYNEVKALGRKNSSQRSAAQTEIARLTSIADFTQEVANARIYDGVHYRNSTEVGSALGRKVGEAVAAKTLR